MSIPPQKRTVNHVVRTLTLPSRTTWQAIALMIAAFLSVLCNHLRAESEREYIYMDSKQVAVESTTCGGTVLAPASLNLPVQGGSGTIAVGGATSGCSWEAGSSYQWINATGHGTGAGTVSYSVSRNYESTRRGVILVAGKEVEIIQAGSDCTYSLSPASASIGSGQTRPYVDVTTSIAACPWIAESSHDWVTFDGGGRVGSGTGSVRLYYNVAANSGPLRSGSITVADKTLSITQAGGCTYSFSPVDASFGADAAVSQTTAVVTAPGCSWSASSSSWITLNSGQNGTGPGSVTYSVTANASQARMGSITLNGQSAAFSVTQQNGCTYAVASTGGSFSAAGGPGGGTGSFTVTTGAGCPWTIANAPSWVTLNNGERTGPQAITYQALPNTGPAKSATMTVAGTNITVSQADGCSYSLSPGASPPEPSVGAAGTTGNIYFTCEVGCSMTPPSSAPPWIHLTPWSLRVSYSIDANTGPARTGTITIGNLSFTITQADGCEYSFPYSGGIGSAGGTGTVTVNAGPGCTWTAASLPDASPWLTIVGGSSGNGDGTITYSATSTVYPGRLGYINVTGQKNGQPVYYQLTVYQSPDCATYCGYTYQDCLSNMYAMCGQYCYDLVMQEPSCQWNPSMCAGWFQACGESCMYDAPSNCNQGYQQCMSTCQ